MTAISAEKSAKPHLFLCSCEKSFTPDPSPDMLAARFSGVSRCTALCTREPSRLQEAAGASSLVIACEQEENTLRAALAQTGITAPARFVDLRNRAGWSAQGAQAGPKMAALLAAAAELPDTKIPFLALESGGITLVLGRDETALEVAARLADTLDLTVLLPPGQDIAPPLRRPFPIAQGRVRTAQGVLGGFTLTLDTFALADPASRAALRYGEARSGVLSRCDLVIDLRGEAPLFTADTLREGYLRADPADRAGVETLVAKARDLVGTFDKPRYIDFKAELCAHSRSQITGCTRCLSVCPTGAITSAGESVAIDAAICAGCGSCASVCPTGAAAYALPDRATLLNRLSVLLSTYLTTGGQAPVILFHEAAHGEALIDALARFGAGLPARVLPVAVQETTQISLGEVAAAFAHGAAGVAVLGRAKPKHDLATLYTLRDLLAPILTGFGYAPGAFALIETDDPDALHANLNHMADARADLGAPGGFLAMGERRALSVLALRAWGGLLPHAPARIALPQGAPFGRIDIKASGCTLCFSCVSACPTTALRANPERPELSFQEDLCVQCGLCAQTCPENVITLAPSLDLAAFNAPPVVLHQEEPYPCDHCGKVFGTRATIERIKTKLGAGHWMFTGQNAERLKLIGYCDDCRIEAATLSGFDPYSGPARPKVLTSED